MATSPLLKPAAQAIFVGPSPSSGKHFSSGNSGTNLVQQLYRVTSYDISWNKDTQDVLVLGDYGALDKVVLNAPTVPLNISYILSNLRNESGMGFNISGNQTCLSDFLNGNQDDKNYFIKIAPPGQAQNNYTGVSSVLAVGNAFVSSYRASAAVGSFATAQVSLQGLELAGFTNSTGFDTPAITPSNGQPIGTWIVTLPTAQSGLAGQISALQPGDIQISLTDNGLLTNNICIQSFDLSIDLNRQPSQCLGSKFADNYEIQFPVNCQLQVSANVKDLKSGRLSSAICANQDYSVQVDMRAPTCDGSLGAIKARYTLSGAKLKGQTYGVDANGVETTQLTFDCPLNGPQNLSQNVFMSGSVN